MKPTNFAGLTAVVVAAALLAAPITWAAQDAARMTTKDLNAMLGRPDVVVLDVRAGYDWNGAKKKITGAVREDPDQVEKWAAKYSKDKTLVLYCS